ncbi:MAG: hypothetical protein ACR2NX_05760 [Chthoniobacterales bacterium]
MAGNTLAGTNYSRSILTVGDETYTARDVIDAAHFRGEVRHVWEELLRMVACEERALEEDREADEAAIDTAMQTFRYDHDLITAEETERWLAERDLTLSEFGDYFTRHYWGEALREGKSGEAANYFSASTELHDLFLAELMLAGELVRMATRFGWRLASEAAGKMEPDEKEIEAQHLELADRIKPLATEEWAARMNRDEAWINKMSHFEAIFRMVCDSALSPQARKREVSTLRLELTMFDLEILEVDSRDAAHEAVLCVRNDGMTMEEVAEESRYPFHREQRMLEDIAPALHPQFLSVTPGKVLEPMENDGAHTVCRVVAKHEPNPDDPAVQRRVEQRVLDRHFGDAMSQHVHWELQPV